jgi:hypothetical protein
MTPVETLGFLFGTSFAAGMKLYATVAALGLLHRYQVLTLPKTLEILANPWVLGIAIVLYVVEFIADKVPWFDSVWDAMHTFIRPPAAAVLAYAAIGSVSEEWRLGAALLAGGIAFTSHGAKATTRAAINTSPEPFSNWIASLVEDGMVVALALLASTHPLLTIVLVIVFVLVCVLLMIKLFRLFRSALRRFFAREQPENPSQSSLPSR